MRLLCPCSQVSAFLSNSYTCFDITCFTKYSHTHQYGWISQTYQEELIIWTMDTSAFGVHLTNSADILLIKFSLSPPAPPRPPIFQQIYGVITHFRLIQICRLAGKESVTLPGPIIGTSQQERLSGNGPSPSQQISRVLGKGHLVL